MRGRRFYWPIKYYTVLKGKQITIDKTSLAIIPAQHLHGFPQQ